MADLESSSRSMPLYSYDISSKIIYLKSYSKILLPGLRIATVILPKLLINTFLEYKKWADMNSPIISQGALEIYLKSGMFQKHRVKIRTIYSSRMKCLRNVLDSIDSKFIKYSNPDGGYFMSLYINKYINYNNILVSLKNKNINLLDTRVCFLQSHKNNKFFRISVSKADDNMINQGIPIVLKTIEENIMTKNLFYENMLEF